MDTSSEFASVEIGAALPAGRKAPALRDRGRGETHSKVIHTRPHELRRESGLQPERVLFGVEVRSAVSSTAGLPRHRAWAGTCSPFIRKESASIWACSSMTTP